jgi:hypothetical protein
MRTLPFVAAVFCAMLSSTLARAEETCALPLWDGDLDGVCDTVDPCVFGDYKLKEPAFTAARLADPAGDETLRFSGILIFLHDTPIDPAATGLRLIVRSGLFTQGGLVLDVAAPGGSGWRGSSSRASWRYRDSIGSAGPVRRASVRRIGGWVGLYEAAYAITIEARGVGVAAVSDLEGHKATVLLDASAGTTQCGDAQFLPWLITDVPGVPPYEPPSWEPRCKLGGRDRRLRCTSGPRVGPCRASLPIDLVLCDTIATAAAQEEYRARHGTYFSGPCDALPGVGSPGVSCTTAGTATDFSATAVAVVNGYSCTWSSAGAEPHLVCT